jgi:hypothetical protein
MSSKEIMEAKGFGDPSKIIQRLDEVRNEMEGAPNQKWHRIISFIKSTIRIAGYILIPIDLISATIVLVLSEVVGIIEELV